MELERSVSASSREGLEGSVESGCALAWAEAMRAMPQVSERASRGSRGAEATSSVEPPLLR